MRVEKFHSSQFEHFQLRHSILFFLSLVFAYLEYKAFGRETSIPMYGYLVVTLLALANLCVSQFMQKPYWPDIRLIINGTIGMGCVITAVYLQKYSAYHALEMTLLIVWMGSLNLKRLSLGKTHNIKSSVS